MTNEELIRRFFKERIGGNEESYGFFVKPLIRESVDSFALFSKAINFPVAAKVMSYPPKNCFVIMPGDTTFRNLALTGFLESYGTSAHWRKHIIKVLEIAKRLKIKFILSPNANPTHFHEYMEGKINRNLATLATDLRTGSYYSVPRSTEVDSYKLKYALVNEPEPYHAVPENYQKLMKSIDELLEGERILGLPKNQVALLDTDEVQSLWRWLIKENSDEKDRELLRKMYMLSRLLAPK